MPHKIAVIFTTFLRPLLAHKTLSSIFEHRPENSVLLIADQTTGHDDFLGLPRSLRDRDEFHRLNFDCGLSHARNFLVKRAADLGCKYCLLTADSIQFTSVYDFSNPMSLLDAWDSHAIVGFDLKGRIAWEHDLELKNRTFVLMPSKRFVKHNNITYRQCDICRNFFLAKTDALLQVQWDEDLKLCEHEDFFWRLKSAGFEAFYTDEISAAYIKHKTPEYERYRNRLYGEFKDKLMKKYNLTKWFNVVR